MGNTAAELTRRLAIDGLAREQSARWKSNAGLTVQLDRCRDHVRLLASDVQGPSMKIDEHLRDFDELISVAMGKEQEIDYGAR